MTVRVALRIFNAVWKDLSGRRGFGLRGLEYDDSEVFKEVRRSMVTKIMEAASDPRRS